MGFEDVRVNGSTLLRVVAGPRGGWEIREPGGSRALTHADTQLEAIRRAPALLPLGGRLQVLDAGGFLQQTLTIDPPATPKPWWYTPTWGIMLGVGCAMLIGGVVRTASGRTGWWAWADYLQIGLAILTVTCALLSRRRQRRSREAAVRRLELAVRDGPADDETD